jgi:hypothetical protein
MLNFKNFSKTNEVLKSSSNKKSIISKESLERILFTSSSYAFIIAENSTEYSKIILVCKDKSKRCFPVVYTEGNIPKTCLLFINQIEENESGFKDFLNELYSVSDISICYGNKSNIKILHENKIYTPREETISESISSYLNTQIQIHGIEIPITNDEIIKYRQNNFIVFAITEQETLFSFSWKDLVQINES